jgi:hypothetical protein
MTERNTLSSPRVLLPRLDRLKPWRVRVLTLIAASVPILALGVALRWLPRSLFAPRDPSDFWALISAGAAVATLAVTIAVGIVAWYGLRSLRLARQDMITRATRESRTLAIERAALFAELLRTSHAEIQKELEAAQIESFTKQVRSGANIFSDPSIYPHAKAWLMTLPVQTRNRITYFVNDLEGWSMWFTQELADADLVFGPCGPTLCSLVLQYAPWIIVVRKDSFAGYYPNLLKLFHAWRAQLDAMEGSTRTEAALRSAQAAEERRQQHQLPIPLGTRVDE